MAVSQQPAAVGAAVAVAACLASVAACVAGVGVWLAVRTLVVPSWASVAVATSATNAKIELFILFSLLGDAAEPFGTHIIIVPFPASAKLGSKIVGWGTWGFGAPHSSNFRLGMSNERWVVAEGVRISTQASLLDGSNEVTDQGFFIDS